MSTSDQSPDTYNKAAEKPSRRTTDRHGRHEQPAPATTATGPRKNIRPRQGADPPWVVAPPEAVEMTPDEYQRAVAAWTALIASWWTDNPPDHDNEN